MISYLQKHWLVHWNVIYELKINYLHERTKLLSSLKTQSALAKPLIWSRFYYCSVINFTFCRLIYSCINHNHADVFIYSYMSVFFLKIGKT